MLLSCSSLSPFFHIPNFLIKPRKTQLLCKVHLQSTSLYFPSPMNRKNLHKCFSQQEQSQSIQEEKDDEQEQEEQHAFQFERLFSNLNQATLKREPGWCIAICTPLLFYLSIISLTYSCFLYLCFDINRKFI